MRNVKLITRKFFLGAVFTVAGIAAGAPHASANTFSDDNYLKQDDSSKDSWSKDCFNTDDLTLNPDQCDYEQNCIKDDHGCPEKPSPAPLPSAVPLPAGFWAGLMGLALTAGAVGMKRRQAIQA